ncbi:MAG TPA: hypothetical protein VKY73_12215 [Polyangiaceae bacterium]|nr:hypothetical protein [Polyangiaceae bacterium]
MGLTILPLLLSPELSGDGQPAFTASHEQEALCLEPNRIPHRAAHGGAWISG